MASKAAGHDVHCCFAWIEEWLEKLLEMICTAALPGLKYGFKSCWK